MTSSRGAERREGTGFVSPDGQLWEVPNFPCPQVVLAEEYAEIDGNRVPPDGTDPRTAATAILVAQARRLRGDQGAIRARVPTALPHHMFGAKVLPEANDTHGADAGQQPSQVVLAHRPSRDAALVRRQSGPPLVRGKRLVGEGAAGRGEPATQLPGK